MSRTCRTCLFKENEAIVTFYSLDFIDLKCSKSVKEMLTVCVPELALDIVSNSVLCSSCANSLESLYEFKTKCLQTERTITSYLQQIPNSSCINLNEISEALLKSNATYSVDNVALSSKTDCKKSESTFEEIHELQSTIKTEELDFDCKDDLNTGYMSNSEGEDTSYDDSKDVKPDLGFHSVFMQISDAQSKCQSDASNLGNIEDAFENKERVDEGETEDEEMDIEEIVQTKKVRIFLERENPFEYVNEKEFKMWYRFSKQSVTRILSLIKDSIEHNTARNMPVSPMNQLLIALRFYATGSYQSSLGDQIKINKSTVCSIIRRVSCSLASLSKKFIRMPDVNEMSQIKLNFCNMARLPGVIGCIGCTHIKVQSPGGPDAETFRNRKGFFSINCQFVCDNSMKIRHVIARWPGSVHDSIIFNVSPLKDDLESGKYGENYLLGDSGYACNTYMLTPLLDPQTEAEHAYNKAHETTHNVVDRAFQMLKRRFPCLAFGLRNKMDRVLAIIVACSVLHNIAIILQDEPPEDELNVLLNPNIFDAVPIENILHPYTNDTTRSALIETTFSSS